jgi:translation elongation factor EF-G
LYASLTFELCRIESSNSGGSVESCKSNGSIESSISNGSVEFQDDSSSIKSQDDSSSIKSHDSGCSIESDDDDGWSIENTFICRVPRDHLLLKESVGDRLDSTGSGGVSCSADKVEEAIRQSVLFGMDRGFLARFPLAGLAVTLKRVDFDRDRTNLTAVKMCASDAVQRLLEMHDMSDKIQILEPIMSLDIQVPESYMGVVLNDIVSSLRRGHIIDTSLDHDGNASIRAEIPLASSMGYAMDLRTKSAGTASFTMHMSRYGAVSSQHQRDLVREWNGGKDPEFPA